MWQVCFSLQSSETVLQGHLWLWGKSLPPADPCCWKLPFSSIIAPLAFCVLVEEVLAVGRASAAGCAWNELSDSSSAFLMLCSLLTTTCSSATCCQALPFCRQRSRLSLHPLPPTSPWEHWPLPEWMVLLNGTTLELFLVQNRMH